MRLVLALSLAALAANPLSAQKPGVEGDPREDYRGQGISICVAEMSAIEGLSPDEGQGLCACALDRFMPRWPTGALPPLASGRLPPALASELLACAAPDADLAAALARHIVQRPSAMTPPLAAATPGPETEPGKRPEGPESTGFDLRAWLDDLSLPGWLTRSGLPRWLWPPLAVLLFFLLRGLFRRPEGQDLLGPPPSMRPGTRPGPPWR